MRLYLIPAVALATWAFWSFALSFSVASRDDGSAVRRAMELMQEGRELTAEQVSAFEAELVAHPSQIETRSRLIGYYMHVRSQQGREARARHARGPKRRVGSCWLPRRSKGPHS